MKAELDSLQPETNAVHAGVYKDTEYGSLMTPIYQTACYGYEEPDQEPEYNYSRFKNPTRQALEDNINVLEGGAGAFTTGGGITAIFLTFMLMKAGDHVILGKEVYSGTFKVLTRVLARFNVEASIVNMLDPEEVRKAVRPNTRMIWIETPSNPLLNVVDIEAIVRIAGDSGALTAIDNTFMTPLWQKPLELGVDVSVYSTSKYINGHSDLLGGVVVARSKEIADELKFLRETAGLNSGPFESWLVLRGIKTLPHRLKAHERNAEALVEFLKGHACVTKLHYPGLPEHPGHLIAKKQQKSFGGMLSFEVDSSKIDLRTFLKSTQIFNLSMSLGAVDSLISQPWTMSFNSIPEVTRREMGIKPELVRISTGIEHPEDLINDLGQAFEKAAHAKQEIVSHA